MAAGAAGAPRVLSRSTVASTRWLRLEQLQWQGPDGTQRVWDMVRRAGKEKRPAGPDAVAILAVLRGAALPAPELLLVRQYRPAVQAHTVELPAGLVDAGETPERAALRELAEETGYTARRAARPPSPPTVLSPGLTDESVSIVRVDIDVDDEANRSPKQRLDDGEFVEVLRCPLPSLTDFLRQREEAGDVVFAAVYTLALGLALATDCASKL